MSKSDPQKFFDPDPLLQRESYTESEDLATNFYLEELEEIESELELLELELELEEL